MEWVFVDEISMVKELFYKILLSVKFANPKIKFVICGDFFQLEPVNDRITKSYELSRALYELVDGIKLNLTVCKRSDDKLYKLGEIVKTGGTIDIKQFKSQKSDINICFTNKQRILVNSECVDRYINNNNKPFIKIEKLHYDDNSQDYTLMEGMPLISRLNRKSLDIVNNETFIVQNIKTDCIIIKNEMKSVSVPIQDINRTFNIGFCITVHKSQGDTFDKAYAIYEWKKMDRRLRYVALTRSTDINNISIM